MSSEDDVTDDAPESERHNDPQTIRGFARIEAILERDAEAERRQFAELRETVSHVRGAIQQTRTTMTELEVRIVSISARLDAIEKRERHTESVLRSSEEVAGRAMRTAGDSRHEVQSIAAGLMAHMDRMEAAHELEATEAQRQREVAELARQKGAGAHARRFDEQSAAIADLQKGFAELKAGIRTEAKRTVNVQWLIAAILSFIILLGDKVLEGMKILHGPPTQQTTGVSP